jgi:hypothetical protein
MQSTSSASRGPLLIGSVLVAVGLILLVGQQLALRVDWLTWPIIGGLVLFVVAVAVGGDTGSGFAALAGIITSAGLVMAVQRETGAYASWTYAWALVAPGGVGLGLMAYGLLTRRWDLAQGGLSALIAGVVLFLLGLLFFEGVVGLSGSPDPDVVGILAPALIIAIGVVLLVGAMVWPRFRPTTDGDAWGSSVVTATAVGTSASTGESMTATAAAAPSAAATSASAPTAADASAARAIDLGDASAADVAITFGAGSLTVTGPAAHGHLVDGTFGGGVRREDGGPGRVKLSTPGDQAWQIPWNRPPFDWRIGLTDAVPLRLDLQLGAARADLELTALRLAELRIRTGAAETRVKLPAAAGSTTVSAEGGAAAVHFQVPDGVAARIRSTMAIGATDIDERRFPRDPLGGWASPDFATAANRVELDLRGGVGSFSVR